VIVRIEEDRLLKCGFADFVIAYSGEEFVAAVGLDDLVSDVNYLQNKVVLSSPNPKPLGDYAASIVTSCIFIAAMMVPHIAIATTAPA
jgi:hypothetical protein